MRPTRTECHPGDGIIELPDRGARGCKLRIIAVLAPQEQRHVPGVNDVQHEYLKNNARIYFRLHRQAGGPHQSRHGTAPHRW